MNKEQGQNISRRRFLKASLAGGILAATGFSVSKWWLNHSRLHAQTFIVRVDKYQNDLASMMVEGMRLLGVTPEEIKGKRILLKPNLVETHREANQINTHPLVVRGAAEAFLKLGAQKVFVAEGPGHRRDTFLVLEESGLADVLYEDRIPFFNLNDTEVYNVPNVGGQTALKTLTFSRLFKEVDWVVSLPKLKTHHWTGVTLSMKNLFGVMPGICYGWPKNVLHHSGINECILDITATLKPHFAIVDGIVGMEGDGPIMGSPVQANVLVMGRNLPAVDATCARLMCINPHKIGYLALASNWLGPIHEKTIHQVGESIASQQKNFLLLERIPAHRRIRLT
ncbi:MAG: DUF362 domain-containing protein [Planctomycetota bacterium]|jgi:uncharacterized protein (DUF362 family)